MSIADKLTTIANNVPLVYEAGKAAGGGGGGGGLPDVITPGDTPVFVASEILSTRSTTRVKLAEVAIPKAGTYRVNISVCSVVSSVSGNVSLSLGPEVSEPLTISSVGLAPQNYSFDIEVGEGRTLVLSGKSSTGRGFIYVTRFDICIDWDNGYTAVPIE